MFRQDFREEQDIYFTFINVFLKNRAFDEILGKIWRREAGQRQKYNKSHMH